MVRMIRIENLIRLPDYPAILLFFLYIVQSIP